MKVEIIKQINDQDFGIIEDFDGEKVKIKDVHGDVLITKGMIEDEPESLVVMGVVEGEDSARIAFWKSADEVKAIVEGET